MKASLQGLRSVGFHMNARLVRRGAVYAKSQFPHTTIFLWLEAIGQSVEIMVGHQ